MTVALLRLTALILTLFVAAPWLVGIADVFCWLLFERPRSGIEWTSHRIGLAVMWPFLTFWNVGIIACILDEMADEA